MNKNITLFILASLILTTFVSATVAETNSVYNGLIKADGSVTNGNTVVNSVSVLGFTCINSGCTAAASWFSDSTGSDNKITINYPTNLYDQNGYLIYFYKEGYVPYGVRANWSGNGNAGSYNDYLRKVETGKAQIEYFGSDKTAETGKSLTIDAEILSPMVFTKDWYVPQQLESYYKDDVKLELQIIDSTGKVVFNQTKNVEMEWSSDKTYSFEWTPSKTGTYTVELSTDVTDAKFEGSETQTESYSVEVISKDTVPPVITIISPIEGKDYSDSEIQLEIKTNEKATAAWYFIDSSSQAVYLNDIGHGYIFSGDVDLGDGDHTIRFRARDEAGNIADSARVTFTINAGHDDNDGDHEDKEKENKNARIIPSYNLEEDEYYDQFETPETITLSEKPEIKSAETNTPWFIALSIILGLLIIVLIALILSRLRS